MYNFLFITANFFSEDFIYIADFYNNKAILNCLNKKY